MTRNRRMPNYTAKSDLQRTRTDRLEVIYGFHSVCAALCNPNRAIHSLMLTEQAEKLLRDNISNANFSGQKEIINIALDRITTYSRTVPISTINSNVSMGAVHQGLFLKCQPLKSLSIQDSCYPVTKKSLVVLLDQVTDPQNVGAVLRSAEAFGACALIVQNRHSPSTTGALAKAASGALEKVPLVRVTNIERTMIKLKEMGYWILGMDTTAADHLSSLTINLPTTLVLGSEGSGLRRLTRERCDILAKIQLIHQKQSLNVSNAAAIALYNITSNSDYC